MLRKAIYIIFSILFSLTLAGCGDSKPDGETVRGEDINIADFKGKWVVLSYWAPWCDACTKGLAEINKLTWKYPRFLTVFVVSFDRTSVAELLRMKQEYNLQPPLLTDFNRKKYGFETIQSLPATFVISPAGKLVYSLYGPQTAKGLLTIIQPLKGIAEPPPHKPH